MDSIILKANNFSLILEKNSNNSCNVFLSYRSIRYDLGYDFFQIVIQKFLSILDPKPFSQLYTKTRNKKYDNFINLSEKYTSGYAVQTSQGIEILFQNGMNLEEIATVHLSLEECQEWKYLLTKILEEEAK